jgi:hypothetical protein
MVCDRRTCSVNAVGSSDEPEKATSTLLLRRCAAAVPIFFFARTAAGSLEICCCVASDVAIEDASEAPDELIAPALREPRSVGNIPSASLRPAGVLVRLLRRLAGPRALKFTA